MAGVNMAVIVGNLGDDPQIRYMQSGEAVCNLSVATSERWKDRQSGEQREATEWHRINLFGRLAEVAGEYLHKGSKVYIRGSIRTRKWQDQSGQDRYTTEIRALDMQMLDPAGGQQGGQQGGRQGGRQGNQGSPQQGGQQRGGQQPRRQQDYAPPPNDDFDDDIPF